MDIVKQYYLKENQKIFDKQLNKKVIFEKGFIAGLILKNPKCIKIFYHYGWWAFPIEWFNLTKTKEL
jgi:hypothetical protein